MQLPLNVSPVSASFFGFKHPGIHLVLCLACSHLSAHLPRRQIRREQMFSSVSTRADAQRFSKIEGISYSVGKVRVGVSILSGPQPLESGNQSVTESLGTPVLLVFPVIVSQKYS
jgi:hypothetical protein